ncbi:MAG: N-acetylmuramoyl-L-alanine amidase, partial [Maribacter sp.]
SNPEEAANPITFKVQLMASSKDIALDATHFKGLGSLSREPVKSLYRNMYGETRSYREAEMMQAQAAEKGYPTAYIVAYRSGERIPLKIALKEVSQ